MTVNSCESPRNLFVCLLIALATLGSASYTFAENNTAAPVGEPSVAYRRVYVPADNPAAWPTGSDKFLPVESVDFENWIASANHVASRAVPEATITDALYSARLEDGQLVDGRGEWSIALRSGGPVLMPLEQISLFVRNAHWKNDLTAPMRLGAWGHSGEIASVSGIEVPRSGVVGFEWSVPAGTAANDIEFAWRLPSATTTRVLLDLPAGKQPVWDGALVVGTKALTENTDTTIGETASWQRWEMIAGPAAQTTLRIADLHDNTTAAAPSEKAVMREAASYEITPRGLDIEANLQFDDATRVGRQLSLPLPSGVQLVSATCDGQELSWRLSSADTTTTTRAIVEMPVLRAGEESTIVLRAWQVPAMKTVWRLPKLRPDNVFWAAGTVHVTLSPLVELQSSELTDCFQTDVNLSSSADDGTETLTLSEYSPAASVDVVIGYRTPFAVARIGTTLVVGNADVTGRSIMQLEAMRGAIHSVRGELPRGWNIDAVETTPSDALGQWYIDERDGRRYVEVQLAEAVRFGQPISLTMTGRLQPIDLGAPLAAETLRMICWDNVEVSRDWLSVQAGEPYIVETIGDLPLVANTGITEEIRTLLPAATEGPIYNLHGVADTAAIRLDTKKGRYTGHVWLDAQLLGNELRRAYHLIARAQSGRLDQILVYATERIQGDIRWTEKSSGMPISAERVPADDPSSGRFPNEGELWWLHLPRPRANSVEIVATSQTPWTSRGRVPLLSLPDATDQRGRVLISVGAGSIPRLEVRGLRAIPLPTEPTNRTSRGKDARIWAAYRYDPAQCQDAARRPVFWLEPKAAGMVALGEYNPFIARHLDLESYFTAGGKGVHRATYALENNSAERIEVRLPEGAQLTSAQMDGQMLDLPTGQTASPAISIPLSAGRSAIVSLSFGTQGPPLAAGSRLEPPVVDAAMPVLAGEWTIWLPTDFSVLGPTAANAETNMSLHQRLLGPLGRPTRSRPFDPSNISFWSKLMTGWAEESLDGTGTARGRRIGSGHDDVGRMADADSRAKPEVSASFSDSATNRPLVKEQIGWRPFRRVFVADLPAPVVITQPSATMAYSIAVFLLCLMGGGLWRRHRDWYIVVLAVAAILCLVLPAVYAPLATGAFLGLVASLFVVWHRCADSTDSQTRTWSWLAAAGGPAAIILVVLVDVAKSQENSDAVVESAVDARRIERVLIPVDADRRSVGTKVYASERFLRQLVARGIESSTIQKQWLITSAAYSGDLRPGAKGEEIVSGEWNMSFDVEVLGRDTTIRLPLVRDEANWPTTARLDGIPSPLRWDDGGRSCVVEVAEPGHYQLTVSFVPKVRDTGEENQIAVSFPPHSGAELELRRPAGMAGLEVSGANLALDESPAVDVISGELEATGQLLLRWPRGGATAALMETQLSVLRWLQLGGTEVEMGVKYVAPQGARLPQSLTISGDRRWQLMNREAIAGEVRVVDDVDQRNTTYVSLGADVRERGEVRLRWRLAEPTSVGRLRVPSIELSAPQVSSSWMAISSDPALECDLVDSAGWPAATAEEFLALWGGNDRLPLPQIVLANVSSVSEISVGLRPRSVEPAIEEVLHVAAGAATARVQYQAVVTPDNLHRFQFPLDVSPELAVDEIDVTRAGEPIEVRWSRPSVDRVTVFFGEELSAQYRVTFTGHVPVVGGSCSLPRVASATRVAVVERAHIYRDEAVLVEVEGPANADDAAADLPPPGWRANLVGAYQLESNTADQVRLAIRPNDVATLGETLTTLTHEESLWWTTWRARLRVQQGELDTLRLRVPLTWAGRFEVQPADATVEASAAVDDQHAVLSVRLPESVPAGQEFSLEIRGPMAPETGVPVAVPEVTSEATAEWQNYLAVPTSVQSQELVWTHVGVRSAEPPSNLRRIGAPRAPEYTFRVTDSPFQVALAPQRAAELTANVRLADTTVSCEPTGHQLIATRFVVNPQGATECEVRLPLGHEVLSVKLDGQPARCRALDDRRWELALGPPQLPQVVDVISRDVRVGASNLSRIDLERPEIRAGGRNLSVEMSLWSIGRAQFGRAPQVEGAAMVNAIDQAGLRLDRLSSIAETATATAVGMPMPDGYDWFRSWVELLADAQDAARDTVATSHRDRAASQVARSSGDELAPASNRIATWVEQGYQMLGWPDLEPPLGSSQNSDGQYHWPPRTDGIEDWVYCVADGSAEQISVRLNPADEGNTSSRMLGALAIAVLAAASVWLVRQPAARDALHRWPHAVGVLAGLCWWAWLSPSWVGVIIATGSLFLLFRPGWPGRSIRPEASTVIRVARPN